MSSKPKRDAMSRNGALICAFSTMEHAGMLDARVLNETEAVLHNLHWFTAILGSDGFEGLFFGGLTDDYLEEIYAAVERFGAKQAIDVFKRALAVFPERSRIGDALYRQEVRRKLTKKDLAKLSKLSQEFNGNQEITDETLLDFIQTHRSKIRFEVTLNKQRNKFRFVSHHKSIKLERT